MSATSCNVRVLRQKAVASDIRRLTVALPKEGPRPHAGQFYMLRCWGAAETPVLSRPISVHDVDEREGTLTFLYQDQGRRYPEAGPPGLGPDADPDRPLRQRLRRGRGGRRRARGRCGRRHRRGAAAAAVQGAGRRRLQTGAVRGLPRCALCAGGLPALLRRHQRCDRFRRRGLPWPCHRHFAPGGIRPGADLRPQCDDAGLYRLCAEKGVPCLASLERKMACGLGACLGCTCHTKVGPKTVCQDGPVFPAQEVFDLG